MIKQTKHIHQLHWISSAVDLPTGYCGTHTHTKPFYGSIDFVYDNPGELGPEESFTHSHLSWSSIIPYLLFPCNTIHGILPIQSMRLTVFFHNLSKFSLVLAWHPPLHTPYISSPNCCLFFATHDHTIAACFAVLPRLCHLILVSLSTLYLEFYLPTEERNTTPLHSTYRAGH